MIPIRDQIQSKSYPIATRGIIGVNILVFVLQMMQGENLERFIFTYGLVPARYSMPEVAAHFTSGEQVLALFSFMFLHGGFLHLLGNMWFLHIFGDNVEDRMGSTRFLLFYFLCGWTSGFVQLWTNWASAVPTIGASGAIAGVMGAYFVLYPHSRVLTLIPIIFIFTRIVELPAIVLLGFWFLMQLYSAGTVAVTAGTHGGGGVAFMAHVAGFLAGVVGVFAFRKRESAWWANTEM